MNTQTNQKDALILDLIKQLVQDEMHHTAAHFSEKAKSLGVDISDLELIEA